MIYDENKFKGNPALRTMMNLFILLCAFFVFLMVAAALASWVGGFFTPQSAGCYLAQAAVQNILAFCGAAIAAAYLTTRHPWKFLGVANSCSVKAIIGVIIIYFVSLPAMNQIIYYNSILQLPSWMSGLEQSMKAMEEMNAAAGEIMLSASSVGGLIATLLIVGLLTGFSEELFFRGALQRTLTYDKKIGVWAIWISAFIFSAVHLQFYGFFPRLLIGAFFGYMIYSTGSIWPGAFGHALNNSVVVVTKWLERRGHACFLNDDFGVIRDGFPWWALLSAAAVTLILTFSYSYFFSNGSKAK